MNKAEEVSRIMREATEVRFNTVKLCSKAGIAETTWWRIRKNPETLTLDTLDKLEKAIRDERAVRSGAGRAIA